MLLRLDLIVRLHWSCLVLRLSLVLPASGTFLPCCDASLRMHRLRKPQASPVQVHVPVPALPHVPVPALLPHCGQAPPLAASAAGNVRSATTGRAATVVAGRPLFCAVELLRFCEAVVLQAAACRLHGPHALLVHRRNLCRPRPRLDAAAPAVEAHPARLFTVTLCTYTLRTLVFTCVIAVL